MSNVETPDLSVVLVSYNTCAVLRDTLSAVLADRSAIRIEPIVVDNASHDGSAAMVRDEFPGARLFANADNRFYVGGNNQGLAAARGRYVLVLNPDAKPDPGTLREMVAWMDAHPDVGLVSPLMTFSDGTVQRNCARLRPFRQFVLEYTAAGLLMPRARRAVMREYWYDTWDRRSERDVAVVPGSCMMVRRETLDQVGGFDAQLRMYFGEDDWCLRIARAGWRVVYAPIGCVVHDESASVSHYRQPMRRLYFRDMIRYVRRHFGAARAVLLLVLSEPMRLVLDGHAALQSRGRV